MSHFLVWGLASALSLALFLAVLAGLAIIWRAHRQGLLRRHDPSLQAWADFDNRRDLGLRRLIAAATLAPSPHNSQPWRFSVSENQILLRADFSRKLGAMDPFEREMFIGLGCALENMAIAAPGAGLAADIALRPDSKQGHAALITVSRADRSPDPLERFIVRRRTDRGAYDVTRPIDEAALGALRDTIAGDAPFRLVLFPRGSEEAARFGELTIRATQQIVADRGMSRASAHWYRHGQAEIDARRDGLTMQTQAFAHWKETLVRLMPQVSEKTAHIAWLRNTRMVQLATAAQIGVFVVPPEQFLDDQTALAIGRAWQRLHLKATELGLACQPMSQIPERIARERQLGWPPAMQNLVTKRLAIDGVPAFCFRIGTPTQEPPHAPRRMIDAVMDATA